MPLRRFRIQTLMIAVAMAAVALFAARCISEDDTLIVLTVFMSLPAIFLATCAFLVVRYRHL